MNLNIVLDNVTLDNVDSEKLLGVIVDKYLTRCIGDSSHLTGFW